MRAIPAYMLKAIRDNVKGAREANRRLVRALQDGDAKNVDIARMHRLANMEAARGWKEDAQA